MKPSDKTDKTLALSQKALNNQLLDKELIRDIHDVLKLKGNLCVITNSNLEYCELTLNNGVIYSFNNEEDAKSFTDHYFPHKSMFTHVPDEKSQTIYYGVFLSFSDVLTLIMELKPELKSLKNTTIPLLKIASKNIIESPLLNKFLEQPTDISPPDLNENFSLTDLMKVIVSKGDQLTPSDFFSLFTIVLLKKINIDPVQFLRAVNQQTSLAYFLGEYDNFWTLLTYIPREKRKLWQTYLSLNKKPLTPSHLLMVLGMPFKEEHLLEIFQYLSLHNRLPELPKDLDWTLIPAGRRWFVYKNYFQGIWPKDKLEDWVKFFELLPLAARPKLVELLKKEHDETFTKNFWESLIDIDKNYLQDAPEKIAIEHIAKDGLDLKFASDSFKNNIDIILMAIRQDTAAYYAADENIRSDDKYKKLLENMVRVSRKLSDFTHSVWNEPNRSMLKEIKEQWVKSGDEIVLYEKLCQLPTDQKSFIFEELEELKVIILIHLLQFGSKEQYLKLTDIKMSFNLKKLMSIYSDNYPAPWNKISNKFRKEGREIIINSFFQNEKLHNAPDNRLEIFQWIYEEVLSDDEQGRSALVQLMEQKMPREFCKKFILHNSRIIAYGKAAAYASKDLIFDILKDKDKHDIFLYISKEWQNDRKFILEAMSKNPDVFSYIPAKYKEDEEIFITAVKNSGFNLRDASEKFKKDENIVLIAIRESGAALEYASETIQKHPYFKHVSQVSRSLFNVEWYSASQGLQDKVKKIRSEWIENGDDKKLIEDIGTLFQEKEQSPQEQSDKKFSFFGNDDRFANALKTLKQLTDTFPEVRDSSKQKKLIDMENLTSSKMKLSKNE